MLVLSVFPLISVPLIDPEPVLALVGVIQVDAHADINDEMFGEKFAHGTPFRRAVEEGLLDCERVVQMGLRGTGYTVEDFDWSRDQGFKVVTAENCRHKSLILSIFLKLSTVLTFDKVSIVS
jgi:arginase family enzyme